MIRSTWYVFLPSYIGPLVLGLLSAADLPFGGQPLTGAIGTIAQSDTYEFSGNAGDVIDFTLVTTSGKLSPRIRIYTPAVAQLSLGYSSDIFGNCAGGLTVELNNVKLPAAGTYTALVDDCGDSATGNYLIFAQRINEPVGAAALQFGGQPQAGRISAAAASNTYTFNGTANDIVDLMLVTTNGKVSPKIRIFNPSGTQVSIGYSSDLFGNCAGGGTVELNNVKLPLTGMYTALVADCTDNNTGTYNLSVQCIGVCASVSTPTVPPTGGNAQTLYVSGAVVGEFDATTGFAIDRTFITGVNGRGALVVSGNTLFVASYVSGTVGTYDGTTGTAINANFITGLSNPTALALSGNTLFVANQTSNVSSPVFIPGTVGAYDATTGVAINANFITGLSSPGRLAVSGNILFVLNGDIGPNAYTIGEYDVATGRKINSLPPLNPDVTGLAVSGNVLYLANFASGVAGAGSVGTYSAATGAPINPNFITGLSGPEALAASGNALYVTNLGPWPTTVPNLGTVGKYDATTGAAINATLIGALNGALDIAVTGPAQTPPTQSFDLTSQVSPAMVGTITATPSSAGGTYPSGSRVCLTASASSGWAFQNWTGAALDSAGCLVMDSDKSVTAVFVAVGGNSAAASIQVTSLSAYGALPGNVAGVVSGVATSDYQIAPLIFLSGLGWFSKPLCNSTTVRLGQDGAFSTAFTTGGVDQFATKIALLLLPTSVSVPCYSSAAGLPLDLLEQAAAQVIVNRPNPNEREIQFSGQAWAVKASPIGSAGPAPIGPGPCVFSDNSDNVAVDSQGRLHLKITNRGGTWTCAEVYSRAAVSYGTSQWTITGFPTLDPTSVFGAFTWADAESTSRELDTEIGFTRPGDSTNAQWVVQPASISSNLQRITLPTSGPITFKMTWMPSSLSFQAFIGTDDTGTKIADWTYAGSVPPADRAYANFRFNLWLNGGPPASDQVQEAVISGFQYKPFVEDTTEPSLSSVGNGASFAAGSSPGAIFTAFGQNLAKQALSAPSVPLPATLSDVSVYVNGIPAPLFYVSPTQINGQVPYIAPLGPSQAQIVINGHSSQVIAFDNSAAAPGIFTSASQCVAQNQDNSLNTPNSPAATGSVLTAYLTGIGQVDNPVPTGAATPSSPLSRPTLSGTAQLDGQPITIEFLGLAPGLVGVGQANIRLPLTLASGQRVLRIAEGGAVSNACAISVNAAANGATPAISSLGPSSTAAGGPTLTLTVSGTAFVNGSTVQWDGSPLATTFVNATQLQAAVPATFLAAAGSASVTVVNPGNLRSDAATFTITAPPPVIGSVSPSLASAGGSSFTLTVNGTGFVNGSTVQWNGSPLPTTFVGTTQLQAAVSATLIASAGNANVTVANPGGAASNAVAYPINPVQTAPSLSFCAVPTALPRNLGLGAYSPGLCFQYSGLSAQKYTLSVWLLETQTGAYFCASTQWCQVEFYVDNTNGNNSSGQIVDARTMDVYDYSGFLWVARLGELEAQQSANAVNREPPQLNPIGNKTVTAGQSVNFVLSASDTNGYSLVFQAQGVPSTQGFPPGASFDTTARSFSWPSPVSGTYQILFNVVESTASPLNDSELITITVN